MITPLLLLCLLQLPGVQTIAHLCYSNDRYAPNTPICETALSVIPINEKPYKNSWCDTRYGYGHTRPICVCHTTHFRYPFYTPPQHAKACLTPMYRGRAKNQITSPTPLGFPGHPDPPVVAHHLAGPPLES